jgi:hypothetical protein
MSFEEYLLDHDLSDEHPVLCVNWPECVNEVSVRGQMCSECLEIEKEMQCV